MKIRFEESHLLCFSAASFDRNPSHLSAAHARKTSAGERVVYGILGFLACLRAIRFPEGRIPIHLRIDFKSALLLNIDYTISVDEEESGDVRIFLLDGSVTAIRARLRFRDGIPQVIDLPAKGTAPLVQARELPGTALAGPLSFRGLYAPGRRDYENLLETLEISRDLWGDALPLSALCSSYLTGMEMPGETAIYSGLKLDLSPVRIEAPFAFEMTAGSYNAAFGLLQSHVALRSPDGVWAESEISAITRRHSENPAAALHRGSGRFSGKSALIIGASRGLGASMALELAAEGGIVVGVYAQSHGDAEALTAASRDLPGRLSMECGDASDPSWCRALRSRIQRQLGALDLLVCNAAPPIHPVRIEEAYYERMSNYLNTGFALAAAPLSVFLELVSASHGSVLVMSSSAVEQPPPNWPHYVALKGAIEGLVRTAAAAHPKVTFWIARPGRVLTDLSDTPMGRLDAEEPRAVAQRILRHVSETRPDGGLHFSR